MAEKTGNGRRIVLAAWLVMIAVLLVGIIILWPPGEKHETIKELMLDGVLHESNKISFLGLDSEARCRRQCQPQALAASFV